MTGEPKQPPEPAQAPDFSLLSYLPAGKRWTEILNCKYVLDKPFFKTEPVDEEESDVETVSDESTIYSSQLENEYSLVQVSNSESDPGDPEVIAKRSQQFPVSLPELQEEW